MAVRGSSTCILCTIQKTPLASRVPRVHTPDPSRHARMRFDLRN
jgi:hypothetical protein